MRDYGKVYSRIWESADFRSLSEDGRALVLYLLTCQHGTIAGVFRVPDGYACEDLQWSVERVSEGFANLHAKGFATRCEASKWVWVTKFLEWNPPENPNQRKAAAKVAMGIPDSCCWKARFIGECGPALGIDPPQTANPSETVPEPFPNQEQEQKQKQESIAPYGACPPAANDVPAKRYEVPDCPHTQIVDLYHEHCPTLPRCEVLNDSRRGMLRQRWREVCTTEKFDAPHALEWWRDYFTFVAESKFLTGRAKPKPGDEPFLADFEWLIGPKNFAKVIERRYHRAAA
jgi:hypothetical protein